MVSFCFSFFFFFFFLISGLSAICASCVNVRWILFACCRYAASLGFYVLYFIVVFFFFVLP